MAMSQRPVGRDMNLLQSSMRNQKNRVFFFGITRLLNIFMSAGENGGRVKIWPFQFSQSKIRNL